METNKPIVSLCLPTNGAIEWVIPTLESVYKQNVDYSLFEVVITDNGEDSQLDNALKRYSYPNLKYYRTTDKGFLNLVTCLQKGTGLYNKMLNHRMLIEPNMLSKMIDVVLWYKDKKPVMYFLNGCMDIPEYTECDNLSQFISVMNIYCSWSAGIGFWDVDIEKLSEINTNEMFPNASLLFEHRTNSDYIIWNGIYGKMQDETGKGGYDLFQTFGVELIRIIESLYSRGRIDQNTFFLFKKKNFKYLINLYVAHVLRPSKNTFDIKNIKESISVYYNVLGYYKLVLLAHIINMSRLIRGI